jgi:hypothetical protein
VQGLDRYAYVNNNPVKYNDPSGHDVGCAGIDMYMCGIYGKSFAGWANYVRDDVIELLNNPPRDSGEMNRDQIFDLLPDITPAMKGFHKQYLNNIKENQVTTNNSSGVSELEALLIFVKEGASFTETFNKAINITSPVYKTLKYAIPSGPIEAAADAILQGMDDFNKSSYSTGVKVGRAVTVGFESLTIDALSSTIGGVGGLAATPELSPIVGGAVYFGLSYASSYIITDAVRNQINPSLFPAFGLGDYP